MNDSDSLSIFTIGHSTRPLEEFIEILKSHDIGIVVDIRTIPRSRHNPQFNRENLPASLETAKIGYRHLPGLGGLRRPNTDSPNTGWQNASFRGFADYMQTPEFGENLASLIDVAKGNTIVLMCAEAVPWRCHRSLIADALAVRGIDVKHLISLKSTRPHHITPWAKIKGTSIIYPAPGEDKEIDT
jgi:uncharacterized protein (DUF488 family)